jgi:xanthine dehydrogenase molybdenum-binding subunit
MGLMLESSYLEECMLSGAEKFGWNELRSRPKKDEGRIKRGYGMATMSHCTGAAPLYLEHSNAMVKVNEDGSVDLTVYPAPVGTHIWGALSQICAEELGIRAEDVNIVTGDTDVTLFEYGSDASRSTYAIGGATLRAARQAKEQLLAHAAAMLEVPVEDLLARNGRVFLKSDPDKGLSVGEVCYDAIYSFGGEATNFSGKQSFEPTWNSPTFGAYFAEVEVDTETGRVRVPRFVTAIDCGKAINPMAVEGQLEGGLQQGLGYALTENFVVNETTGKVETANYDSYKVPGTLDMPHSEVIIVDRPDPKGPFGAKGVGEPGMVGIPPAIANAIYDAIGVRVRGLPMTPERILAALAEKGEAKGETQ